MTKRKKLEQSLLNAAFELEEVDQLAEKAMDLIANPDPSEAEVVIIESAAKNYAEVYGRLLELVKELKEISE